MALLGLSLPDTARLRLDAGAPELRLEELSLERDLEPGRPVRLIDRGAGVVASGIADPENGVVRIYAKQDVRAFDLAFFKRRVAEALDLRRAAGLAGSSDEAYRLVNEAGDGLPGLTADVYGAFLVITVPGRGLLPVGRLLGEAALAIAGDPASGGTLGWKGVVVKVRGKDPQDRSAKEEVLGETPARKADRARAGRALRGPSARLAQRWPVHGHARTPAQHRALRGQPARAQHVRLHRGAVGGRGPRRAPPR